MNQVLIFIQHHKAPFPHSTQKVTILTNVTVTREQYRPIQSPGLQVNRGNSLDSLYPNISAKVLDILLMFAHMKLILSKRQAWMLKVWTIKLLATSTLSPLFTQTEFPLIAKCRYFHWGGQIFHSLATAISFWFGTTSSTALSNSSATAAIDKTQHQMPTPEPRIEQT